MRVPLDIRLLPIVAIALALLFALVPLFAAVAVWCLLGLLLIWLVFRAFSRPPRTPAETRFWPFYSRRGRTTTRRFFEREPRPDTDG